MILIEKIIYNKRILKDFKKKLKIFKKLKTNNLKIRIN